MRLLHIVERRPRNQIKLDPITEEDFSVSLSVVSLDVCR